MPTIYDFETLASDDPKRDEAIGELARLFAEANAIAFLTGAGVSTDSKIPDFRSPTGVYATTSEELFSIDSFTANPSRFYAFFASFYRATSEALPNSGHAAIAALERRVGKRVTVVTQNIDGLHGAAGSTNVVEIHGSLRRAVCLACEALFDRDVFHAAMLEGRVPHCPRCGGVLKPDVVFFGEPLPERAFIAARRAMWETKLLAVVGTSLQVYPAAGLPRDCDAGAPFVVVNRAPTQLDSQARLVFRASIAEVLPQAVALLPSQAALE